MFKLFFSLVGMQQNHLGYAPSSLRVISAFLKCHLLSELFHFRKNMSES